MPVSVRPRTVRTLPRFTVQQNVPENALLPCIGGLTNEFLALRPREPWSLCACDAIKHIGGCAVLVTKPKQTGVASFCTTRAGIPCRYAVVWNVLERRSIRRAQGALRCVAEVQVYHALSGASNRSWIGSTQLKRNGIFSDSLTYLSRQNGHAGDAGVRPHRRRTLASETNSLGFSQRAEMLDLARCVL